MSFVPDLLQARKQTDIILCKFEISAWVQGLGVGHMGVAALLKLPQNLFYFVIKKKFC